MADEKPTLVLAPGLLCTDDLWRHQIDGCADLANIHLADTLKDNSLGGMASRLLEDVNGPFALAGLSMGGYLAFEIMRRAPERVTRLALLDTSARPDTPEQTAMRKQLVELSAQGPLSEVVKLHLPGFLRAGLSEEPVWQDRIGRMAEAVGQPAYVQQQQAIMARVDSRPGLSSINVPTLVICGGDDGLTTVEIHREICDAIPGARLEVIDNCGHLSPMEQPETVTRLLRGWLCS